MQRPSEHQAYPPDAPYPFDGTEQAGFGQPTGESATIGGNGGNSKGIYPAVPGYPSPPASSLPAPAYPVYGMPTYPPYMPGALAEMPRPVAPSAAPASSGVRALLPLVSLVASFIVYAWIFGWQFGVGILALLFVHEIGHYIVIRAKGLPAGLPVFIPLIGAYVEMRRMPNSVRDEAEIAIAGPAAGALSGIACYLLYQWTQQPILLQLTWFAFFLNLLNLIPIAPLDGGRVVGAISRWIWLLGLGLVVVGFFYLDNPADRIILLILGWLGFSQLRSRFGSAGTNASYYRISLFSRIYITFLYVGLAGALALGLLATQQTMVSHLLRLMP